MNVEETIRNAFNILISEGNFIIDRIVYDEKSFGNICVNLSSAKKVNIRFIKDRGVFWCEVGQEGEWFFIEDVFTFMGVDVVIKSDDMIGFIEEMSTLIKNNTPRLFEAFNAQNSENTQFKIKALAKKRALGMFKQ